MRLKVLLNSLLLLIAIMGSASCVVTTSNNDPDPIQLVSTTSAWPQQAVWDELRNNFSLPSGADLAPVRRQIAWYQKHPKYLYDILANGKPYLYYIYQQTQERKLPAELALIPVIESQYNPFAYSRVGATGLWQMMPGTASGAHVRINWWYDGRRDISESTQAALDYLTYLHTFFNNNWLLALAAYDSGAGTVEQAIIYNHHHGRKTDFWDLPLPQETRAYIPKLLAIATIIQNPSAYGIRLPYIPNEPYFEKIKVGSQIDISTAAKLAGLSTKALRDLNSGYRRWATDPHGPHTLFLPINKIAHFKSALKKLENKKRVTWEHYIVQSGDTLGKIAHHYDTSVHSLRQINNLKNRTIHPREHLLIPVSYHGSIKKPPTDKHHNIAEEHIPGPRRVAYNVKPSDNLWSIAKLYGVSEREIRFWNSLSQRHALQAGEQLTIWTKKHHIPESLVVTYKVKSGDSLIKIANHYHTSVKHLKKLNQLSDNTIHVGEHLKVLVNAIT